MKVIFLDIDGVLNSKDFFNKRKERGGKHHQFDPECVKLLNDITDSTNALIVISSSWRVVHDFDELTKLLHDVGIKGKIIGKTERLDIFDYGPAPRGVEIQDYLNRKKLIKNYIILDDDTDMLYSQRQHFFNTSWETGLTRELTNRIIKFLK